jgi:long-subunit acyl-CoA synthetase (AMP-forming)
MSGPRSRWANTLSESRIVWSTGRLALPTASSWLTGGPQGDWKTTTYAEALTRVRRLARGLLERGLSPERPLMILSGNSVEHGLLALAAM